MFVCVISTRSVSPRGLVPAESLHARLLHGHQALSQGAPSFARTRLPCAWTDLKEKMCRFVSDSPRVSSRPQVKSMANPFAYDEYRKDKIRQKIEESRTQRVQVKVRRRSPDYAICQCVATCLCVNTCSSREPQTCKPVLGCH